jgi:hypothetical protein
MSLTSDNLVGYLPAEFCKSGRIRVWLFRGRFSHLMIADAGSYFLVRLLRVVLDI